MARNGPNWVLNGAPAPQFKLVTYRVGPQHRTQPTSPEGRRDAVADAKMCLETHLGYHPVYLEMGEAERELDQEIAEAQRILGVRPRRLLEGEGVSTRSFLLGVDPMWAQAGRQSQRARRTGRNAQRPSLDRRPWRPHAAHFTR